MFFEELSFSPPTGLEEPTRPETRPVQPERPLERADHIWLADGDELVPIGSDSSASVWLPEMKKIAALLDPHYRHGDEASFEITTGYAVAAIGTSRGWLMAVGIRGQEVRDLRRDALVMARLMMRILDAADEVETLVSYADIETALEYRVNVERAEVEVAQRLWGTNGPLILDDGGRFRLMSHARRDAPIEGFARAWDAWAYRFRLATGRSLPCANELVGLPPNPTSSEAE